FAWVNVALLVAGIIVVRLAKKGDRFTQKSAAKFNAFAWTMGLLGIILYGFRQINVLYLSAPVLILVWGIVVVIWLILVLNYHFRVAPKRRETVRKESQKRVYL
ncbi:MAG: hypothetical protein Q8P78_01995, partial [bacterium]|nr:hypothetical protein [bacterium]